MTWRSILSVVVGLTTCGCVVPYIRDILNGETRPQRMSWIVFASLATAATVAQIAADGVTSGALLAAGAAVGFGSVALLSIRHGEGGFGAVDLASIAGLIAVLAIWSQTENEALIITLIIAVELPAVAVTAHKGFRNPRSETLSTWLIDGAAGVGAVIAVPSLSLSVMAFPVYHALSNMSVASAIIAGGRRRRVEAQAVKCPLR